MPGLDLSLHEQFVGVVAPDRRDRSRVLLDVDPAYVPGDGGVLLSEGFATLPGRRPPIDAVSNFLGGYVPEGTDPSTLVITNRHEMTLDG